MALQRLFIWLVLVKQMFLLYTINKIPVVNV